MEWIGIALRGPKIVNPWRMVPRFAMFSPVKNMPVKSTFDKGAMDQSKPYRREGTLVPATWVVLTCTTGASSTCRSLENARRNAIRASNPGRLLSSVEVNASGVAALASDVWNTPTCARISEDSPNRKRCSKRACGCHNHGLPAPVRGETPTWASEFGSRGETIGLSCPTRNFVDPQSSSRVAIRSRMRRLRLLLTARSTPNVDAGFAKKSMYRDPSTFAPHTVLGLSKRRPKTVCLAVPPAVRGTGFAEATVGNSWAPLNLVFM